jgi:hypothetical protein
VNGEIENLFDEGWLEWLAGCYRQHLHNMPEVQRLQLEAAFYAGAAFGGRVANEHGHAVVINAIKAHLDRHKESSA